MSVTPWTSVAVKKYEECSVVCQDKKKTTISLAREAQVAVNSNDSVIVCVIVGFLMLLWSISYQQWLAAEKMKGARANNSASYSIW